MVRWWALGAGTRWVASGKAGIAAASNRTQEKLKSKNQLVWLFI